MPGFTLYIDEAGDEGFGKLRRPEGGGGQSRWLIIGGFVVRDSNNNQTASWRDGINSRFPQKKSRDLHWRDFKHEQKVVVASELAKLPIGICIAASHKVTIPGSRYQDTFKQKGYLYNYLVRWQLERVIDAVQRASQEEQAVLRIVFSRRGGTNYQTMAEYLEKLRDGMDVIKSPRQTNWSVLDVKNIRVENHSKSPGLQLADCVTSSFFSGLEPNAYGNTESRYGRILSPKLLRRNQDALDEGLTIVPSLGSGKCSEEQIQFIQSCRTVSGQVPGS